MKRQKKAKLSNVQIIALGFFIMILLGTGLLMLPIASVEPGGASFGDALFTATSASCVTGLVQQDTGTYWTTFGQMVIIVLIQIGGLGFMTIATLFLLLLRRRMGLRQREVVVEGISYNQLGGFAPFIRRVFLGTLLIEGLGAVLLSVRFAGEMGLGRGIYYGVWHSVSAFCNAGFDLMGPYSGPYSSFTAYAGDPLVSLTICALILVGGLGFLVWDDLLVHGRHVRRWRLHSKIVVFSTTLLFAGGAMAFYFIERDYAFAGAGPGKRALMAAFQSVTCRTAGFNTAPLTALSQSGTLLTMSLMFIGAGSGSTGGGAKVNTIAVLFLSAAAQVRRKEDVNVFRRRLDTATIQRAYSSVSVFFMACLAGTMVMCLQGISLDSALFEAISAVGTVGLTRGVTPYLPELSKLTVLLMMFAGRVGSMSVAMAVTRDKPQPKLRNIPEKILIG